VSDKQAKATALRFRETYLLNICLAVLGGKEGDVRDACDLAEAELTRLLLSTTRRQE
jgi:hypothetical protein